LNQSTVFKNLELACEMPTETKLPVWRTVTDAYGFVFHNLKPFFALAAIPIALLVGLWIINLVRHGGTPAVMFDDGEINAWRYFEKLINLFIWTVFAVSWHRYVLLGKPVESSPLQFHIGRREFRFFLYDLIFVGASEIVLSAMDMFSEDMNSLSLGGFLAVLSGFLVVEIVIFIVWTRCLLLFPAVAVEGDEGFVVAWNQLRGTTWRLISTICIASIPVFPHIFVFASLFGSFDGSAKSPSPNPWQLDVILAVGMHIGSFVIAAVAITVLSVAFRQIADWSPPTTP
jgi:hypothetical protein